VMVPAIAITWATAVFVNASSWSVELVARTQVHADAHWAQYAAAIVLAIAALHALWHFGFSAWLEPMVGNHHSHHHQHEDDQHCGDGCHQHIGADSHAHAHEHEHVHGHSHDKVASHVAL
jgi:ABC-type nickel/cobalt efflux system permease component RcnA